MRLPLPHLPCCHSQPPANGADGDTLVETAPDTAIVPDEEVDDALDQPWHVIIFNDPVNLMSFVSMVIQRVFGYTRSIAEKMMLDVHQKGRCTVWTGARERAEHYVQQLQSHQLQASIKKAG